MDLHFDTHLAAHYNSKSQKARVVTEKWVADNLYCPICGNEKMKHFPNNMRVADFYCTLCGEQFELKSKNGNLGRKVADGAYETFIKRITDKSNPDFLFMSYQFNSMQVTNLLFVPKFLFTPAIVEKRKPLGAQARRHGWIGCNILYDQIPQQGKISIIENGIVVDKNVVRQEIAKSFRIKEDNIETRGWLLEVLQCVNNITTTEFDLAAVYQFEKSLELKYPDNHNIRAKIRQQLQVLRDRGIIEFLGDGYYRKI